MNHLPVGPTIKRLLEERWLKQADLCKATGLKSGYVSNLMKQDTRTPSLDRAKVIADFFGMTLDELYEECIRDTRRSPTEGNDHQRDAS